MFQLKRVNSDNGKRLRPWKGKIILYLLHYDIRSLFDIISRNLLLIILWQICCHYTSKFGSNHQLHFLREADPIWAARAGVQEVHRRSGTRLDQVPAGRSHRHNNLNHQFVPGVLKPSNNNVTQFFYFFKYSTVFYLVGWAITAYPYILAYLYYRSNKEDRDLTTFAEISQSRRSELWGI